MKLVQKVALATALLASIASAQNWTPATVGRASRGGVRWSAQHAGRELGAWGALDGHAGGGPPLNKGSCAGLPGMQALHTPHPHPCSLDPRALGPAGMAF